MELNEKRQVESPSGQGKRCSLRESLSVGHCSEGEGLKTGLPQVGEGKEAGHKYSLEPGAKQAAIST